MLIVAFLIQISIVLPFCLKVSSSYTLNVSCSTNVLTAYFDGIDVTPPYVKAYVTSQINVARSNVSLIALRCDGTLLIPAYIIASGTNSLATDSSWICDADNFAEWYSVDFDDSDWQSGGILASSPKQLNNTQAIVSVNAQWLTYEINSVQKNEATLTCRQHVDSNPCLKNNLCQNGGSCAFIRNEMKCWCESQFTGSYCESVIPTTTATTTRVTMISTSRSTSQNTPSQPVIVDLFPSYGPEAGGTVINIVGSNLLSLENMHVYIGNSTCQISSKANTLVTAVTPPVQNVILGNNNAKTLLITFGNQIMSLPSQLIFTYRKNPVIANRTSLSCLVVSGGTKVDVTGDYLDSVASPAMELVFYIEPNSSLVVARTSVLCQVTSASKMICPTPDMLSLFSTIEQLRSRFLTDKPVLINGVKALVGFLLDGVKQYGAESSTNSILLYGLPAINSFQSNDNILTVSSNYNGAYQISGIGLNWCYDKNSYTVMVEKVAATVVSINNSVISFTVSLPLPPIEKNDTNHFKDGMARVYVLFGEKQRVFVGYLKVVSTNQHLPIIVACVVAVGVALILTIICLAVLLCRHSKQ